MVRKRASARPQGPRRRRLGALIAAALSLAACAPVVQHALAPPVAFAGPRLEADHVVSFDGAELALQTWLPEGAPWAVVVAVHGMSEYADAFYLAAPHWAERGIAVYAYDQRGFGRSPGRGVWAGGELMAKDLDTVVALVAAKHPGAEHAVLGESMGAAVVMAWMETAPAADVDRVILVAPAVRGWSNLPVFYRLSLWTAAHLAPRRAVRPPANLDIQASDNIDALIKNGRDPLYLHDTRIDMVYGLVSLMDRADKADPGETVPTLLIHGEKDEIIAPGDAAEVARRMGPCGRAARYPQGWHMLLRDLQAPVVWGDVEAFLRDATAPLPSQPPSIEGAPETISPSCSAHAFREGSQPTEG